MRYFADNVVEDTFRQSLGQTGIGISQVSLPEKKYEKAYAEGDSSNFGANFLGSRKNGFINESWDKTTLISGRVLKITDDLIHCDCILSLENQLSQVRAFPSFMFGNVYPLRENICVKIKTSIKAGSTRIDIIDGKNLGIEQEFESFDIWTGLEDFDNKPAF